MIRLREDCFGQILPRDYRRARADAIVIHRNTVSDIWRTRNLLGGTGGDVDDTLATALFHRESPAGSEHFRLFPYHFFVDRHGVPNQTLPYTVTGQHSRGRNASTVGVAMCWDARISEPPDEIYDGLAHVVAKVWVDFGYRSNGCDIIGHSLEKACPGPRMDLERLRERAKNVFEGRGVS